MGNIENTHTQGLQYNRKDWWQSVRAGEDSHMIEERKGERGSVYKRMNVGRERGGGGGVSDHLGSFGVALP